jgi:hypothetical protein
MQEVKTYCAIFVVASFILVNVKQKVKPVPSVKQSHFASVCHSQIRGVESVAIGDTGNADGKYSDIPSLEVASIYGSQRKYSDIEISDGKVIQIMINTGADVNVLDAQLVDNLQGVRILPPDKKILAYGPRHERVAFPVVKKVITEIRSIVTNKSITATFCLIRNVDSLLSCVSAEALELVFMPLQ